MASGGLRNALIAAIASLTALAALPAQAQAPDCKALARRIADFDKRGNSALSERYDRAARKQRDEIDRTVSYGEQSGCWGRSLYDETPAVCRQLDLRLSRMRANLDDLQFRADEASRAEIGGDSRESLTYEYDLWCRGLDRPAAGKAPIGRIPDDDAVRIDGATIPNANPGADLTVRDLEPPASAGGDADANSVALCVRICDGGYFPLSAPVRIGRTENLQALCSAQCPGTPAKVFINRKGEDVSKATALDGDFYAALPNAFKFRKKYDPACACKPAGKDWNQVLTEAEKLLQNETGQTDKQVPDSDLPKIPLRGGDADAANAQTKPRAAPKPGNPAAVQSAPTAPSAAAQPKPEESGDYREIVGPDGVKRKIRIVGPKL